MWEIWANQLQPKALKTCPKSNISPNLVTLATLTSNQTIVAYCVANFYVRMPINSLYCKISAFEKNNWKRIIVVFSSTLIQIALSSNKSHFDQHEGPYIWNSHSISTGNTGCLFKEDSRTRWLLFSFHYFLLSVK